VDSASVATVDTATGDTVDAVPTAGTVDEVRDRKPEDARGLANERKRERHGERVRGVLLWRNGKNLLGCRSPMGAARQFLKISNVPVGHRGHRGRAEY
jgi:hypothetical protein